MQRQFRRYGTLIGFLLLIVFFWLALPNTFMTARNLLNISQQMSMLAVVAFTMTIVMAAGDFDLSAGSMASLAGIVAALVFKATGSVPMGLLAALSAGLAGGLFNGGLVAIVGLMPFVATLGTLTIYSGLAFWLSGGKTLFGAEIPAGFSGFARGGIPLAAGEDALKLPNLTLTAAAVLMASAFLLHRTVTGRHLYAIGSNIEAARLAGVRVRSMRIVAFGLSSLGAAGAGLLYAARVASANPTQGCGLMLDAIAAVFLGMTMSAEGEPRAFNTLIGVLILGVLSNGLTQLSVDSYVRDMLVGAIILAAVSIGRLGNLRGS